MAVIAPLSRSGTWESTRLRRLILGILFVGLAGIAACNLLLPDEFVVNAPIAHMLFGRGIDAPTEDLVDSRLKAASGHSVQIWADGIAGARFMRFTPAGDLIVSQPADGRLLLVLADRDGDGRSDGKRTLLADLDRPHGFDFRAGFLYVGETGSIARVAFAEEGPGTARTEGDVVRIVEGIPSGGNHWSRTLRFGPDGGLYVSVGSSCNVCEEKDPRRAALLRYEPDGSGEEIYASGLRNSVGFDWQPGTDLLYATDNGRDLLGDETPPCELNSIDRKGFYGWPYAYGDKVSDPDFGPGNEDRVAGSLAPAHPFRAHNAPLGITFVRHPDAAADLQGAALVALHGSWNRTVKDGYKVVSLHWDERGRITERDFLTGFNIADDVIGRPVDIAEGPEGDYFVSDNYAGVIYRVARKGMAGGLSTSASPSALGNRSSGSTPTDDEIAADLLMAIDAPTRARLEARGATLFAERACGTCHLAEQAGPGVVVKRLQELNQRFTVESMTRFFATPQPPMPVVDLPAADRRALAIHVLGRYGN